MIEVTVALAGVAVVAIAAAGFWVGVLAQRDQSIAIGIVTEQPEVVWPMVAKAVKSGRVIRITEAGKRLETEGPNECWTVVIDTAVEQGVLFGRQVGAGCTAPAGPNERLTVRTAVVTDGNFSLTAPNESGRSITMVMTVEAVRPLWRVSRDYSQVFVNVVDEVVE